MGERIGGRLAELGPNPGPLDVLRTVAAAFLPTDDESRAAMLLYHAFAAAALTDVALRGAEFFRNEANLRAFMANHLNFAREAGDLAADVEPDIEARGMVALLLGLSLTVLLEPTSIRHAERVLDSHLARLRREPRSSSAGPGLTVGTQNPDPPSVVLDPE